jgi:creatinine amidohydrolase
MAIMLNTQFRYRLSRGLWWRLRSGKSQLLRTSNALILLAGACCFGQSLPIHWEDLTAEDFVKALAQSGQTCTLPFGIIEKHGPAGTLGTDLINVRYTSELAARQEYTILFPAYYFGQIFEARHQPGTLAYSTKLQLELLQETVAEMNRNGCKKIIIVNGHGGNNNLLQFFAQSQLDTPKDYLVYAVMGAGGPPVNGKSAAMPSKPGVDGHAGEGEVSNLMASRPGIAHPERAREESGKDLKRLDLPSGVYTGIWWYASFPNHYQGDAAGATEARGKAASEASASRIAAAIRAIKSDQTGPRLQKEFFEAAQHPIDTK